MTATTYDPTANIRRMVPPGDHRVLDIDITNRCDVLRCSNCTRGLLYQDKRVDMTPENFRIALESVKDFAKLPPAPNGHRVIAMIGGNPTMHPQFEELCGIFRDVIPDKNARGLWTNNINGHGKVIDETFGFFNLNVHGNEKHASEMRRELKPWSVFGSAPHRERSLHSSMFTAIQDFVGTLEIPDEKAMWDRIEQCDINKHWSGSIVQIDGHIYGYFCEIAASFESIYGHNTGIDVAENPRWWMDAMSSRDFHTQAAEWCQKCGISLKLRGHEDLDFTDDFSKSHGGLVQIAVRRKQKHVMHETLPDDRAETATDYQRLTTPVQAEPISPAYPTITLKMPIRLMHLTGEIPHDMIRREGDLAAFLQAVPFGSVGVEVGVFAGKGTRQFLASGRVNKLYCVDCWKGGYDASDHASGSDMVEAERLFDEIKDGRVVKVKEESTRAARDFKGHADFVYIDADHRYESVKRDIQAWLPKIRPGGFISGHDYDATHPDVVRAVNELLGGPHATFPDGSWIVYVSVVLKPDYAYPMKLTGVRDLIADGILQLFSHRITSAVLADWFKAMVPGATVRVSVPDFARMATSYAAGRRIPGIDAWLLGAHETGGDIHGSIFDEMGLRFLMHGAGFRRLRRWDGCRKSYLGIEGVKPLPVDIKSVIGVMSIPRVGWCDTFNDVVQVCDACKIPMDPKRGVYWDKVFTIAMQSHLRTHKYILAIDYDSIFTSEQVTELYRLMEANPEADAICATQMRRKIGGPLITVRREGGNLTARICTEEVDDDLLKVASAHFGLTLIRTSSLASLSRPWFKADAGPTGDWLTDGWVDADVAFWRKWEAEGKTLYQANYVPAGHLELTVSWPSWDGSTHRQAIEDWQENGMPAEVKR